jgi:hypothetical protein
MPVILASWEAKMGRIAVLGQPRKIACETPFPNNNQSKMDWRCDLSDRVLAL